MIAQAGSSGQELGARIADLIYTAQKTREDAVAFSRSVKEHGAACGRAPDSMLVMPGIPPVMGRTRGEAEDRYGRMQDLVHARLGLPMLADTFGDLSAHDLDGPLPPALDRHNAVKSTHDKLARLGRQEGMPQAITTPTNPLQRGECVEQAAPLRLAVALGKVALGKYAAGLT